MTSPTRELRVAAGGAAFSCADEVVGRRRPRFTRVRSYNATIPNLAVLKTSVFGHISWQWAGPAMVTGGVAEGSRRKHYKFKQQH